jgi:hypothetical protein
MGILHWWKLPEGTQPFDPVIAPISGYQSGGNGSG